VHGFSNLQFAQAGVTPTRIDHETGNDADGLSAMLKDGIVHGAHQSLLAGTGDAGDVLFGQQLAETRGGIGIPFIDIRT
jgi:hypothetical protein